MRPRWCNFAMHAIETKGASMDYEWNSTLFRTRADMLDAIAHAWIGAWGRNSREEVLRSLNEATDADLAAELIETWGLDQPRSPELFEYDERPSHMSEHDYTKEDLTEAFARARAWHERNAPQTA